MKRNLPAPGEYIKALKSAQKRGAEKRGGFKMLEKAAVNFSESVMPQPVEDWLGRLSLMYGVPFEHLVPNADMLPAESIRFFHVDANWISCLQDGATSIGNHSTRDEAVVQSVYEPMRQGAAAAMQLVRRKLAGADALPEVSTDPAVCGMLVRSQLISGWPGIEIAAYESYTISSGTPMPGNKISNLRIERLAPDVMLCLYPKMPALVQFSEPKEGLSFGLASNGKFTTRFMGYHDGQTVGRQTDPNDWVDVGKRPGNRNVIDVLATRDALKTVLKKRNALGPNDKLTPADFAIQLIKTAEQQSFVNGPEAAANPNDCADF